jgi:hypothetical protein
MIPKVLFDAIQGEHVPTAYPPPDDDIAIWHLIGLLILLAALFGVFWYFMNLF